MRISEAAKILGVSVETLRNWERAGKIPDYRCDINGQRHYTKDDVNFIRAKMGRGRHVTYRKPVFVGPDRLPKGKKGEQVDLGETVIVETHDWQALYEFNDSEFWDWYHGKTPEEKAKIVKDAPEYLIYHIQRARSATSRPEENSTLSTAIMPPE